MENIDVRGLDCVATASNEAKGKRACTRISIFYKPEPDTGRAFVAQVEGLYDGNVSHCKQLYVGSLDRAIAWFKPSALTDHVRMESDDWMERNQLRFDDDMLEDQDERGEIKTFIDAVGWLYEGLEVQVDVEMEKDFGMPEYTFCKAYALAVTGKPTPDVEPFVRAMRFFDRAAWRASR